MRRRTYPRSRRARRPGPALVAAARSGTATGDLLLGVAFDHAPVGMALVSPEGRWLRVNDALCELLGYGEAALLERTYQDVTHPDDLERDLEASRRLLVGEETSYSLDKRYVRADGVEVWAQLSVSLVRDGAGAPLCFIAQVVDITDRRDREARLRHLADHDPLTALLNRRSFAQALERQLLLVARTGVPATLLLLDLDGFKAINDTLGHAKGDEVLRAVADRLRGRLRRSDVIGRLGGDEFALLLAGTGEAAARAVADSIHADLATIEAGEHGCRASVGIVALTAGATTDELLAVADRAMYAAKRGGGGR